MEKESYYFLNNWSELKEVWKSAFHSRSFTIQVVVTLLAGIILAALAPVFLPYIQGVKGTYIHDIVLDHLPSYDVSLFIFICLYTVLIFTIVQLSFYPALALKALQAYVLLTAMRACCIYFFPLEPHSAIIPLIDPLTDRFFYAQVIVTKDLFFSGHVSTLSLLCLVIPSARAKRVVCLVTILVAFLLLHQHAHYTIDLLAAPVAAWIAWKLVRLGKNEWN